MKGGFGLVYATRKMLSNCFIHSTRLEQMMLMIYFCGTRWRTPRTPLPRRAVRRRLKPLFLQQRRNPLENTHWCYCIIIIISHLQIRTMPFCRLWNRSNFPFLHFLIAFDLSLYQSNAQATVIMTAENQIILYAFYKLFLKC